MPLSLQIMAMLTWKEIPCVEFLQIAYSVNCCIAILIYLAIAANEAFFCDCYCNMEHFLCGVERIKRFVNVHLHRHWSAVFPPRGANTHSGPPELLRSEISFSRTCNISKQWKSTQTRSHLNGMCILLVSW